MPIVIDYCRVMDGGMRKLWIMVVLVNFLLFGIGGCLAPIGYFYNDLGLQSWGTLAILLALFFAVVGFSMEYEAAGVLPRFLFRVLQIKAIRQNAKNWLTLHWLVQVTEAITLVLFFFSWFMTLQIIEAGSVLVAYTSAWFLLFSVLAFPYFHLVRNFLGMGYDEIEDGSMYGVKAIAHLSSDLINHHNRRGIEYLSTALYMLNRCLRDRNLSLNYLDKAMVMLWVVAQANNKVEYEQVYALSKNLSQEPLLQNAAQTLESFVGDKSLGWAAKFDKFKGPKRSWIEMVTIIAVLTGTFGTVAQAILPETQKEIVLNWLSQFMSSPSVIMLFPIAVLTYGLLRYVSRLNRTYVSWRDVRKIKVGEG